MDIKDTYNKISAEMNKPKPRNREETAANYDKNSYWSTESVKKKTAELISIVKNWHEFYLPPAEKCLQGNKNSYGLVAGWRCRTERETIDHFCQIRGINGVPCLYRGNDSIVEFDGAVWSYFVTGKYVSMQSKKKLFSREIYYPKKEFEPAIREASEDWERIRKEIEGKVIGSRKFVFLSPRKNTDWPQIFLFSDGNIYGKLGPHEYINDLNFNYRHHLLGSEDEFWEEMVKQVALINMGKGKYYTKK